MMKFKIIPIFIVFIQSECLWAQSDEIILSFIDRAPYYYLQNNIPKGFLLEWQIEVLKTAKVPYKVRQSTAKGILNRIRINASPICSVGWFKNDEREKFGNFTDAIYQNKPLVALIRSSDKRFKNISDISNLFANQNLTLGKNSTFSYGDIIDNFISEIRPPVIEVSAPQKTLIHMLKKGRFDYMLMAPEEVNTSILKEGFKKNDFKTRDLGLPQGNKRYLFCSKKVPNNYIERINTAIYKTPVPDSGKDNIPLQ